MRDDETFDLIQIFFEEWKPVPAFPMYEISNLGHLRKKQKDGSYRQIHASPNLLGYFCVTLSDKGRKQCFYLHRLVAEAFLPPSPNGWHEVNHRTEQKNFNEVFNLEFTTRKLNCNWGTRNEKIGKAHSKVVEQYDLDGKLVKTWKSMREAGDHGFKSSCVSSCCRGKQKTYKGFVWRYKEN